MAEEVTTGYTFLYTTLHGDATLMALITGVYRNLAPPGSLPPYVIIGHQAGHDVMTANAWRVFTSDIYQVKVIGPESTYETALVPAANRIDALLGRTSIPGVLACYREQQFALFELVNGVAWLNLGGMFRILI